MQIANSITYIEKKKIEVWIDLTLTYQSVSNTCTIEVKYIQPNTNIIHSLDEVSRVLINKLDIDRPISKR